MMDRTIALSNGLTFTRSFVRDPYRKYLINAVSNCFDSVSVSAAVYAHDFLLRRTNIIYTAQSGTNTLACSYNARSEVTGVKIDTNDYAYVYDNIGNSLYTSLNTVTNAYTVNNLNQYKAITNLLDLTGYKLGHDADGNTVSKGGDMVDVFHFWYSTKYLDHDTGLYYYGYRYYSPMLQRWINRDPIEERGGVNLYEFCRNDVYNKFDYLGNVDVPQTISVKKCHAYLYIGHAKKSRPIKWIFPSDGSAYGGAITCWPSSNNPENEALRWPNAPFHEGHMFDTSTPFGKENSGKEKYSSWDMSNDSVPEHVYEGDPVRALQAMWSKEALDKIKETLFSKPHCCKIITFEIFVGKDMWLKNQIKLLVSKYNWQQGDTRRIKVYKGSEYED